MNWILIGLAVLLGLAGVIGVAVRRMIPRGISVTSAASLHPIFDGLLSTPDSRGHVFVRVGRGPESLQFHRRESQREGARVFLEYPVAPWSEPYRESISRFAREAGFTVTSRTGDRPAILVDCGVDMPRVSEFAWQLLSKVYDVGAGKTVLTFALYRA